VLITGKYFYKLGCSFQPPSQLPGGPVDLQEWVLAGVAPGGTVKAMILRARSMEKSSQILAFLNKVRPDFKGWRKMGLQS
jgi:hypothetical protein